MVPPPLPRVWDCNPYFIKHNVEDTGGFVCSGRGFRNVMIQYAGQCSRKYIQHMSYGPVPYHAKGIFLEHNTVN